MKGANTEGVDLPHRIVSQIPRLQKAMLSNVRLYEASADRGLTEDGGVCPLDAKHL
jgi:hypothetical protein